METDMCSLLVFLVTLVGVGGSVVPGQAGASSPAPPQVHDINHVTYPLLSSSVKWECNHTTLTELLRK